MNKIRDILEIKRYAVQRSDDIALHVGHLCKQPVSDFSIPRKDEQSIIERKLITYFAAR